tara:strand:+ start:33 stop:287 length:255 start_codon:yes stop_codon:yes gene_type:complete
MKLTTEQLKRIIKEELEKSKLSEDREYDSAVDGLLDLKDMYETGENNVFGMLLDHPRRADFEKELQDFENAFTNLINAVAGKQG